MHEYLQFLAITLILCSSASFCRAQSLGEVARQQQQKKSLGGQPKPRYVLTDDDMKPSSTSSTATSDQKKNKKLSQQPEESNDPNTPSVAALQKKIKEQKQLISEIEALMKDIQERLDKWKTSDCTHVVYAGTGKNTCDLPPRLSAEYERAKSQLETEQANLEEMQEEARRLGYGNSVYDPK